MSNPDTGKLYPDSEAATLREKLAIAEWRNERLQSALSLARIAMEGGFSWIVPEHELDFNRLKSSVNAYSAELDAMNAAGWLAFVGW